MEQSTDQPVVDGADCCCGPEAPAYIKFRTTVNLGEVPANGRNIPRVSHSWTFSDHLGRILVRLGFNRMNYAVRPGLYASGAPGTNSPVLVSASYKLSFDILRREISGIDAWVLVLDTKGVNVWCAAGKGTFGSKEIARLVIEEKLSDVVTHRTLIVPQLGAPGVSAGLVDILTGFKVIYGPVQARDLRKFMDCGFIADDEMRSVTFGLFERLTVALMELMIAAKPGIILTILLGTAALLFPQLRHNALALIASLWTAIFSGAVFTPALLPLLPGRPFSVKGAVMGGVLSAILVEWLKPGFTGAAAMMLSISAVSAYIAFNFTGASTFTSLSGVRKELRFALPVIAVMLIAALVLGVI